MPDGSQISECERIFQFFHFRKTKNFKQMKTRSILSNTLFLILIISTFFACVPARQVEELKEKQRKCEDERNSLSATNRELETKVNELTAELTELKKLKKSLVRDTTLLGNSLSKMTNQYEEINRLNEALLAKQTQLTAGKEAEHLKLMQELEVMKDNLLKREDDLRAAERELDVKKGNLEALNTELEKREKRVKELEDVIAQKDAAANLLKDKLTTALLGFKDKGLTIEQKHGKIYVSLEAKLLFPKGSTAIDAEGKKALVELAKALENQKDISILVEGHTDTDKLSGSGALRDNWDLSVLRATAVVRILSQNKNIDPARLTAAGRGEYFPIDAADTPEAKAKNRRIEVILTPDLDQLFDIIENH